MTHCVDVLSRVRPFGRGRDDIAVSPWWPQAQLVLILCVLAPTTHVLKSRHFIFCKPCKTDRLVVICCNVFLYCALILYKMIFIKCK